MPLTDEQTAALSAFADAVTGADAKEVADALKASAPDVYQVPFRVGFGTAKGEAAASIDAKDAEIAALTESRDAEKARADALGGKDADFTAERERLEKVAADAKAAAESAQAAAAERIRGVYVQREAARLKAAFVAQGVDPDYAEHALVPKALASVRVGDAEAGADPTVSYLDADGVPLSGGLDAFVGSHRAAVADKFLTSPADGGSAISAGGGNGGADKFDRIRERTRARNAAPSASKSLDERMGIKTD